ncbi:MAG: hypothetical protein MJA32_03255, partial [Proteobacteria bacterium]|nr:hypothetical protein [Pseudomonadota bacterium]
AADALRGEVEAGNEEASRDGLSALDLEGPESSGATERKGAAVRRRRQGRLLPAGPARNRWVQSIVILTLIATVVIAIFSLI